MAQNNTKDPSSSAVGIYLLPNLFTTGNLFAGFYAIVAAINGHYEKATFAIFLSMILDILDGRVARLTNTQSSFGAEYDSLSDIVAFGIAPALIVYTWSLDSLGKFGWLTAFFYTATTAIRLARFNSKLAGASKRYFEGLPSPAGAGFIAATIGLGEQLHFDSHYFSIFIAVTVIIIALLMVSNIQYNSFKDLDFKSHVPYFTVILIVLLFVGISIDPPKVLFCGFLIFTLSGPILWAYRKLFKKN